MGTVCSVLPSAIRIGVRTHAGYFLSTAHCLLYTVYFLLDSICCELSAAKELFFLYTKESVRTSGFGSCFFHICN